MNVCGQKSAGGRGGGADFASYVKSVIAFLLLVLPQLATSTVLDKLRDDPDLSQVRNGK